ncbi:signal recognition particle-docking protein FtsY [Candidatus Woesearchaeota archaeon]|nr:signal recognition particle-docking protein FtsY [Candidatus Woesearchaeota archaeon]
MFGFLKKKLGQALATFSRKVDDATSETPSLPIPQEEQESLVEKKKEEISIEKVPQSSEKQAEEKREKISEQEKPKQTIFQKLKETVTKTAISASQFDELFWELELVLLENNVAVEVIEKIKEDLKKELVDQKVLRGKTAEVIRNTLIHSVEELFQGETINLIERINAKKEGPYIMVFVGINGSGKTTTIAKIAALCQANTLTPVIAAADTFRAAAIQQLEEHGRRLGVKVVKHDYGADPAAVAFDAIAMAKSKKVDVVLIDTAGRIHANINLMDEMKKIIRVTKPDLKIFVGESITGNDCIDQVREFNDAITIDGIILAKADVDEKGGTALSVSYVTGKPIVFLGTGQGYADLKVFDKHAIIAQLGLA